MIYKIVFGFAGKGQGWAETHSMLSGVTNPNLLKPTLANLAQLRANFLGAPYALTVIRISKFFDEATNTRQRGTAVIKKTFVSNQPNVTGPAEPADVALIARGQPNVADPAKARFNGNANQTFLGAPSDDAVTNGGDVLLGNAGLGASFASWELAMRAAGMGWLAVDRADDVKLGVVTQLLDGTVQITLQRNTVAGVVLNKTTNVRVRAVNQGRSPLNGQLTGQFTALDTFVTNAVIGIPTPQIGGFMRIYAGVPVHLSYLSIALDETTGQHDRGKPFGSPRGRKPKRVRG